MFHRITFKPFSMSTGYYIGYLSGARHEFSASRIKCQSQFEPKAEDARRLRKLEANGKSTSTNPYCRAKS